MNDRSKKRNLNFYKWTSLFCLSLVLISGSVLISRWWERKQQSKAHLEQIRQKIEQYELQSNHLISTVKLSQSPQVKISYVCTYRHRPKAVSRQKANGGKDNGCWDGAYLEHSSMISHSQSANHYLAPLVLSPDFSSLLGLCSPHFISGF
jgi:hypothetical protein